MRSLGRPIRVLDLGANIGLFGAWALGRFPVESILALKPDPENASVTLPAWKRSLPVLAAAKA
jgi:hypothetical protein